VLPRRRFAALDLGKGVGRRGVHTRDQAAVEQQEAALRRRSQKHLDPLIKPVLPNRKKR